MNQPSADKIRYVNYQSEAQMPHIMELMQKNLSEPYTVYTYRFFINDWSKLCFMAYDDEECIGAIVCKIDKLEDPKAPMECYGDEVGQEIRIRQKGYIAMLVVKEEYRKLRIGTKLVKLAISAMIESNVDEIVLETEVNNKPAQSLYENLGFLRDKRLFRYYLNGLDALRLKLWLV